MSADTCQQVVDLMTEYFDGTLPARERLAFERHVTICPPCRAYMAQMRKVVKASGSLREEDLPDNVREGLLNAFRDWKARASN